MTDRALTTPPRDQRRLPGADLVAAGVEDLKGGRETEPALLVSIASTRLRDLGVDIPEQVIEQPQQRLYDLLQRAHGDDAHSRYNGLVDRIVSYANAADHARTR